MEKFNDPVKCPDCSTWWRGAEHKCATKPIESLTKPNPGWVPKKKDKIKDWDKNRCPECGAHGLHGCTGKPIPDMFCHWCGTMYNPRYMHKCPNMDYKK